MAVHDVEVQPIGAGGLDGRDLFAQARKVGGKQAGGDGDSGALGGGHAPDVGRSFRERQGWPLEGW